jgi:hypothetical protein
MEISNIPKVFWYSLSISILALTFGLLFIDYRSTSISIEVANTKIALSQALSDTEKVASTLKQEAQSLEVAQKELLQSRSAVPIDPTSNRDCDGLTGAAKLDCERLKKLESQKKIIEQVQQAVSATQQIILKMVP